MGVDQQVVADLQQLIEQGQAPVAIARATALLRHGEQHDVLHELGRAHLRLRDYGAAVEALGRAATLQSQQPIYWLNYALALHHHGDDTAADQALVRAIDIAGDFAYAIFWRGKLAELRRDFEAAEGFYLEAAKLQPQNDELLLVRLNLARSQCDWPRLAELRRQAQQRWQRQPQQRSLVLFEALANPFDLEDDQAQAELSRLRAGALAGSLPVTPFTDWPAATAADEGQPLRIGYLSANFRRQPGGQLVRGMFAAHDRRRVHVTAYALPPIDDSVYARDPMRDADAFVDLGGLGAAEAAARIRADGIQVLIDLKGWSEYNRQDILALRPAPVQIHYLGHAGPMVAPWIDYQVVDRWLVPDQQTRRAYAPGLIRLPYSYQMNDGAQPIPKPLADRDAARRAAGLPGEAEGCVLVCANSLTKLTAGMFDLWLEVLNHVPDAVLWVLARPGTIRERLTAHAVQAGVARERLIWGDLIDRDAHVTRLQLADLALDTRPCGGHTTTSDCLWAGLPVLAMQGGHFCSRVTEGLLSSTGLATMVTADAAGYRARAVELATRPEELAALRQQLISQRHRLPLFDTAARARDLESGYRQAWARFRQGQMPAELTVTDEDTPPDDQ